MPGDTHAFIVRIWPEALDGDGSIKTWRGSIEHVGDGQRLHFCDLEGAVRFIQEQVGLGTRRHGRWRSTLDRIRREIANAHDRL